MLARSSALTHPSGVTLSTPLLVPSFSSKGFQFRRLDSGRQVSEVATWMDISSEALTETMLVSAYDVFHKHIERPYKAKFVPQLAFLDSGGYEKSNAYDDSTVFKFPSSNLPWGKEKLFEVIESWSDRLPLIIVNFDLQGKSVRQQIEGARDLFGHFPNHLNDFLLKPAGIRTQYLDRSMILKHVTELRPFGILGFTEKELGDSILDRMETIARIRLGLDKELGSQACLIHIFGSLDPLTSCLYFASGAEIFDGLTWLRYAYQEGVAVYNSNYGATNIGIEKTEDFVRGRLLQDNLNYLTKLKYQMIEFVGTGDFMRLGGLGLIVQSAYAKLQERLGGGAGE
ncbi:MAG: hypothetical protein QOF72_3001 [Blastocatellia bacterium]|nr:hypothetical protein [Blastocatellia bacterium]